MPRRVHVLPAWRGFTLIELLIALAVSTLVVTAALSVFLTITASQRRQTVSRRDEALEALDVLRRDITCALPTAFTGAPPFMLAAASGLVSPVPGGRHTDLILTTGKIEDDTTDLTRLRVWRVHYREIPAGPHDETPVLMREAVRLDAPGIGRASETGILFRGTASFDVSVLNGTLWTNHWIPSLRQPLPKAVRIELGWTEAETTRTATAWTVIPAAQVFPSQTPRPSPARGR